MSAGFERFVARRYLLTRKKTGFISIISVISIAGIALGVAALIIVLSLMNGFTKELRTRLVGMDGHIWVSAPFDQGIDRYRDVMAILKDIPGVVGVSPFCSFETVGQDRSGKHMSGMRLRGADIETIDQVSDIRRYVTEGRLDFGTDEEGVPGIVLGRYLAQSLGWAQIGDYVYLFGEGDVGTMLEEMTPPPLHRFRVTGIFDSQYYDFDKVMAFAGMDVVQKILGYKDTISGITLKLTDAFKANDYAGDNGLIAGAIGSYPYYSESWIDMNRQLFSWMKLEKWAAFIMLSLIIIVAAFNIVSTLIMMVMDKTPEIGILKSMGATSASIRRIFVYQGAFVGIVGTLLGCSIGYIVCWVQDTYRILSLPPDIYFVSAVPVELQWSDFAAIAVVTMLLCWLSSFYPANRAAGLDPVRAIKAE